MARAPYCETPLRGARREEADDASRRSHAVRPIRRVGDPVTEVREAAGREGQGDGADDDAVGRCLVLGQAQQAQAEREQHEGDGIGDATERAREDCVDDLTEHAVDAPPLAGRHDDGQGDEGEAEPVASVLRLELARARAHPAHRTTRDVGDPHPGVAHRPQRQRSPPPLALARGVGRFVVRPPPRPEVAGTRPLGHVRNRIPGNRSRHGSLPMCSSAHCWTHVSPCWHGTSMPR